MFTNELAHKLNARHWGDSVDVTAIRSIDKAEKAHLSVILDPRERRLAISSKAGCLLISESDASDFADYFDCTLIVVSEFYPALQKAMHLLHPPKQQNFPIGVHLSAHVHAQAQLAKDVCIFPMAYIGHASIGEHTRIMPFVFIDDDVHIGDGCIIGAGSVLMAGTRVGNRVILQPGTVLGGDGFVYYPQAERNIKFSQIAGVHIADDVEIGANSCVDKGMLENTAIEAGSKIDNLVQVGHDVSIGKNAVIVAQAGLAGHVSIGSETAIGGQAGIAPYRNVGQGARISATAGVFRDVAEKEIVSGNPAVAHMIYLRASAAQKKLQASQKEVRNLQKRVQILEEKINGKN